MALSEFAPARAESAFLGIDCGTSAVRAALVTGDGCVRGQGRRPLDAPARRGGRHEQDPERWWPALVGAVRDALAGAGGEIVPEAVAVVATSGTLLVLDRRARPVGPALMYDDQRAAASPPGPVDDAWVAAGNLPQPTWALPRARWLLERDAVPAGGRLVHQGDYLTARLTGGLVVTDAGQALKTGADLFALDWPERTLHAWGVDAGLLPPVVLPGAPVGALDATAAAELGLPAGVLVRAGTTDGCAGQIAGGALGSGRWTTVSGTTLVVKGVSREPLVRPGAALYHHRHPDGGWLPGGACSAGAGYLARMFPGLDPSAAVLSSFPVRPRTYPLLGSGERFPFRHAGARGFSEAPAGSPLALASALQGLALLERLALDTVLDLGATITGAVRSTGGAAVNDVLNQIRADVLDRPVERTRAAEPAVGAAILAAAPPGRLAETAAGMVGPVDVFAPASGARDRWTGPYLAFRAELQRRGWLSDRVPASA